MQRDQIVINSLKRLTGLAPAGFAIGFHVRFSTPAYMFESYPQSWIDLYACEGMLMLDPTVRWAMHHNGVKRWAELEEVDGAGVLKRAREFGIMYGHTRSIHDGDVVSFGGLSRQDRDFTEGEIDEIGDIIQRVHDATAGHEALGDAASEKIREMAVIMTQRDVNHA